MVSNLWVKTNYVNPQIDYLKNVSITEYDISSAGMNILYDLNMLTEDQFHTLQHMDKHKRVVTIGWLLKDPTLNTALTYGFEQARKVFIEKNKLEDSHILSIKRDAFYLINKSSGIEGRISEHIEFRQQKTFSSFLQINKKEHYLEYSRASGSSLLTKGYEAVTKARQKECWFQTLATLMTKDLLNTPKKDLYIDLLQLKDDFITYQLPLDYYRDFQDGYFHLTTTSTVYGLEQLDPTVIPLADLDVSRNLDYILQLINLILS